MNWRDLLRLLQGGGGQPPAPTTRTVRLPVTGVTPPVVPTATIRLDGGDARAGAWDSALQHVTFTLPATTPAPYGATVLVYAVGMQTAAIRFTLAPFDPAAPMQTLPSMAFAPEPAPEPEPPVLPVPPEPTPVPPVRPRDAIVLEAAHLAPRCPDVRGWPIHVPLTRVILADHEAFERGDTMVEFPGRDLLPDAFGTQGAISYTLWIGCAIQGTWYIMPMVECRGGYVPTGRLLAPGQFPTNLAYYTVPPLQGYQPQPGETVVFFCTTGDTRLQNAQAPGVTPWRTTVVAVPFRPCDLTF